MRSMLLAALIAATAVPAWAVPADVKTSVAATASRSAENVKLDPMRKPAELLAWLGLQKGSRVADMFGGNLYWAEILAPAVGPKGRITVWQPQQFYGQKTYDRLIAFSARQPNVFMRVSPFEAPNLPVNTYDFMLINLDYHDVYWENADRKITRMDPDAWLKVVFDALKPGATLGVVDHIADPGDTRATVEKLHRIDPATVKADFKRAGFVLVGESDMLRNPADDHSLNVFDEKIRGKTDRFVFKFRKPR